MTATWIIINASGFRWGSDDYPTREAADKDLRAFFKGVAGVRFDRFTIVEKSEWRPVGAAANR